jgi:hypothetical protein
MKPILGAPDQAYSVRVEVDAQAQWLSVLRRNRAIAPRLRLGRDSSRIGAPVRAVCPSCNRLVYRLYLVNDWFHCGRCLSVTYASGQRERRDRALARKERLRHRLQRTEALPRHRGRRHIIAEIRRQDARLISTMPLVLLRRLDRVARGGPFSTKKRRI